MQNASFLQKLFVRCQCQNFSMIRFKSSKATSLVLVLDELLLLVISSALLECRVGVSVEVLLVRNVVHLFGSLSALRAGNFGAILGFH